MEIDPSKYPAEVIEERITVPFEYPVVFTRNVFAVDNPLFVSLLDRLGENRRHRAAFYVDDGVAKSHPGLIERIKVYFQAHPDRLELADAPQVVPGGELVKTNWQTVKDVMQAIGNMHLDRQSFIVAIGGGGLLDMVGFATSIVHRGLRLVRLPSTTLAMGDAGIGVKNGMNEHGQKNFVGTFAPPFSVVNDFDLLPTLRDRDWIGGVAEAFKVAIIKDASFFDFLYERAADLRNRDRQVMEETVRRSAALHLEHIRTGGDPFEFGSARPLDFGHWVAHKLEALSGYALGHGQAAAIGIALDSYYAMRQELVSQHELERILTGLTACGLPIWDDLLDKRMPSGELEIIDGLDQFRVHIGGELTVTLPHGIGKRMEVHHISVDIVEEAVVFLRERGRKLDTNKSELADRSTTTSKSSPRKVSEVKLRC